jgi:amidohydrolase
MNINYNKYFSELVDLRRDLHKIPEIAYNEYKTAQYVCQKLDEYGVSYERCFNTGVVALIGKGECVAFRMDMDGLFVTEQNDVSYKSIHDGLMHACGHDGHTAILLMTAKILKEFEQDLKVQVKLIFQPAEEGSGGAMPMIEEGVLKNPDVTRVFSTHLWPSTPVGKVEYVPKVAFAGTSRYTITVKGSGGHGAMPENVKNSIIPAANIILGVDKIHKEEKDAVVSLCAVSADGMFNVFPSDTVLKGTIRTISEQDLERILTKIKDLTEEISLKFDIEIIFFPEFEYPPCANDDKALEELVLASKKALGEENVILGEKTFGAEDFAYFSMNSKAAHIRIGSRNETDEKTHYPLHNAKFEIDESALLVGVKVFIQLALEIS